MGEEKAGDKLSEVTQQYADGLLGLTFNSKPIINNLTIIAGENIDASAEIVRLIEARIAQADDDKRLPVIYLLDSIIKNIGGVYLELFAKNIITTYCNAFEKLDTNNRISMVHLLKTWVGVLPQDKVSAIQERISSFVPSNAPSQQANQPNAIHVNPKYLQSGGRPPGAATKGAPPQGQAGRGAPPARPTSAPGKAAAPPAGAGKNTLKTAPPKAAPAKPGATPATGKPAPATAKPGAPKPLVKPGTGTAPAPGGAPQQPTAPTAKGTAKPLPPGAKGAKAPPNARPPLKSSPIKREGGGEDTGVVMKAGVPVPGAGRGMGRGVPPSNGAKPPARPADQSTGRGRVEHHSKLSEERDHPYRRPPSKFGEKLMEKGFDGLVQKTNTNQPDQQTVIDQAQNILQTLEQNSNNQPEHKQLLDLLRGFVQSKDTSSVLPMLQQFQQQQQNPLQQFNQQTGYNNQYNQFPQYSQQYSQFQQFPQYQNQFSQYPQFQNQQFPQFNANQNTIQGQQNRPGFTGFQPKPSAMIGGMNQGMMGNMGLGGMNTMNTGMGGMNAGMGGMNNNNNLGGMNAGGVTKPLPPSPLGTGSITDLKRQDRSVVNKLYNDFSLQCKMCALRFNDSEKMAKHLDWHFANNRKEKLRAKQAMSRPWYITTEEWAESQGSEASEKASTPFFEAESEDVMVEAPEQSVIADESQPICPICHEKFEQYWDAEAEEWMYRATMISPTTGAIVHSKCFNPDSNNSNNSNITTTPPPVASPTPADVAMTTPPTSPRANAPMENFPQTTNTATSITPTPSLPVQSTTDPSATASFYGVQGIDDLSF